MVATHKPASLNASLLLARKGEAVPAIAATSHNNPNLAWGGAAHPNDYRPQPYPSHPKNRTKLPSAIAPARLRPRSFLGEGGPNPYMDQNIDEVTLTLRVRDETYLRLKYLAQKSGRSTHQILGDALSSYLVRQGIPQSQKLVVKHE